MGYVHGDKEQAGALDEQLARLRTDWLRPGRTPDKTRADRRRNRAHHWIVAHEFRHCGSIGSRGQTLAQ